MHHWKTFQRLKLLLRFQNDTELVCRAAMERVAGRESKETLEAIGRDHDREIEELRKVIALTGSGDRSYELADPKPVRDAVSALQGQISDETRVGACLQWEEHAVEAYAEALREKHPPDLHGMFQRHRSAELVHLASLRALLKEK